MTLFDFSVLLIVGVAAAGGFMRGFVQEVLSLASWVLAIFAIRYLHTDLSAFIYGFMGTPTGAALLAFVLLLLIPYAAMRLIARRTGNSARNSLLGPIDRVLGFGFGAVKGTIVVVFAFSLLVLGFGSDWERAGRPVWMASARTYPFINASSTELVQLIAQRRAVVQAAADNQGG
jgi:membrane protein required for colicin V production